MSDKFVNFVNKIVAPLKRRVLLMISRGIVTLVNDVTGIQSLQALGLSEELLDSIERFQQYGFSSVPLPGAEAIIVFPGGNREHGIALSVDDRNFRPRALLPGEACLYDYLGNMIIIKGTEIQLKHVAKVNIDAIAADIGNGILERVLNGETFQAFFNTHTHVGNLGSPTTPPMTPSDPTHLSVTVKASKGI